MNDERIGVRLSPELRALVAQAGEMSAATRALLIIGAHTAGYDVRAVEREITVLRWAKLDSPVAAEIRKVFNTTLNSTLNADPRREPIAPAGDEEEADPFASIGIEV